VEVAEEPVEVARSIGPADGLELGDRRRRQEGPEAAQGLAQVVVRDLGRAAQKEVVEPRGLVREGNLVAHLEPVRAELAEQDREEEVPGRAVRAHAVICAEAAR